MNLGMIFYDYKYEDIKEASLHGNDASFVEGVCLSKVKIGLTPRYSGGMHYKWLTPLYFGVESGWGFNREGRGSW